jgi:hypothetical protein
LPVPRGVALPPPPASEEDEEEEGVSRDTDSDIRFGGFDAFACEAEELVVDEAECCEACESVRECELEAAVDDEERCEDGSEEWESAEAWVCARPFAIDTGDIVSIVKRFMDELIDAKGTNDDAGDGGSISIG